VKARPRLGSTDGAPLGTVSLQDLLVGRRRDLAEARDVERVLRLELRRRPRRAGGVTTGR
jgi:hypothetical protein